jgi:hypothetical protein
VTEADVTRPRETAAAFIAKNATYVGVILAEMAENAGQANRDWLLAVEAASRGDLDRAATHIVEADIPLDISVRIERQDVRKVLQHALRLLSRELPDDEPTSDIQER